MWKQNSHGIVIPRGKRASWFHGGRGTVLTWSEPLEAGGTHSTSGRGSTSGYSHLGSRGSGLCREAATSQPCRGFGQAEVLEMQSHVGSQWAQACRVFARLSPLASPRSRICFLLLGLVPAGRGAEICVLENQPEVPGKLTLKINQLLPLP